MLYARISGQPTWATVVRRRVSGLALKLIGEADPGSSVLDAPFGYRVSYRSTSSSSPESFGPQGTQLYFADHITIPATIADLADSEHIHRVNKQLRHRMKEVPNLENVEAFFSDFSEPEDNPYHNVSMGESTRAVGFSENEIVYKANPHCAMQHHSLAIRQADRVLSSAWKFNPLYGATAASLEDPPSGTELSAEELKLLESITEKQVAARATRLQRMYAQGLRELQKTKSRNEKRLNIQIWAEDISDLDDAVFAEEVRNNSFCSRHLSSDNIGTENQDVDHRKNHGSVICPTFNNLSLHSIFLPCLLIPIVIGFERFRNLYGRRIREGSFQNLARFKHGG